MRAMIVYGVNPVREAVRSDIYRPRQVHVLSSKRDERGQIDWIVRQMGGPESGAVVWTDRRALDGLAEGGNHQGICAETPDYELAKDPVPAAKSDRGRLVVVLDGITDPQNLGNICRSAVAFGADRIVLPADRSARPGPVVARVSAGALFFASLAVAASLPRAVDLLKEAGFVVIGLDGNANALFDGERPAVDVALAIGSEGKGLRKAVRSRCDRLARIPTDPSFPQLNAATALAVALYAVRSR